MRTDMGTERGTRSVAGRVPASETARVPRPDDGTGAVLDAALALRDREILQRVRAAIRHRQVMLVFQPVVQARAPGRVIFHEAMLRVMDETGRIVPAREFISEVEELEEGRILDCLALEQGLAALTHAPALRLSINMSARSIGYRRWMQVLEKGLAADPTAAERLTLEISERSSTLLPELVIGVMAELHRRGLTFAMDNFGAGQTVLRHFKRFSFDLLKIDGSVIRGIDRDTDNQVLLRAIVAFAEQFDMLTVAESVESQAEAELASACGVNFLQGYHIGAPTAALDARQECSGPDVA